MSYLLTSPPPRDPPRFRMALDPQERMLLNRIVDHIRADNQINVINLLPSALDGRALGSVANIIPEITNSYQLITQHPVKTGVIVSRDVPYRTPSRKGNIRIRPEGRRFNEPHIMFLDDSEADNFAIYGKASLAVVLQHFLFGQRNELLRSLESAVASGRIAKIVIMTSERSPHFNPLSLFTNDRISKSYTQLP